MKVRYIFFTIIIFLLSITHINAARGCCSWHGGISYCGSNGYYICNDGTQSPSCTCSYDNTSNSSNNSLAEDIINGTYSDRQYNICLDELDELKDKNKELKTKVDEYKKWILTIIFINFVYFGYKVYKNDKIQK